MFLRQTKSGLDGQFVAERTEARNHAGGNRRDKGAMPEALTRRRVGEMAFDDRDRQRPERVKQGDRGVGVARGVDDQGRGLFPGLMDLFDQLALVVGLSEDHDRVACGAFAQPLDVSEGLMSVDGGLSDPKQVEVRAVQDVEDGGLGHCARDCGGPTGIGPAF